MPPQKYLCCKTIIIHQTLDVNNNTNLKMEVCFYVISVCFMQTGKANYLHLRETETEDTLQSRDLSLTLIFAHCLAGANRVYFRQNRHQMAPPIVKPSPSSATGSFSKPHHLSISQPKRAVVQGRWYKQHLFGR